MDAKAYIKQQEQRDLEMLNLPQDHDEEAKKPTRKTMDSALVKDESSSGQEEEGQPVVRPRGMMMVMTRMR